MPRSGSRPPADAREGAIIIKTDLITESPPLLVRPRSVLTRQPTPPAASSGLDERVVILIIGLAILGCGGLIAASHGLVATASAESVRLATLLLLTLALQMFSVRVYGRGSVSVSAIGILASAFLFDTGTTMAIAALAAIAQSIRSRSQLYKAVFDAANFAVAGAAASLVFHALDGWRLPAAVLAGAGYAVVNNGLLCLAMSLAEPTPSTAIW